ncbi:MULTISPECIES: hypothetical protein [Natrialbaceae]|uniref:hypothetical protein n=1 Tax=Natrialbaceae TaxID=1644061 RepID=UPI00207CF877|nr:hypothetical protein [Natronococcus sp. CG52]
MATNNTDPKLRFNGGRFGENLVFLILVLQFTLAGMAIFMTAGWVGLTLNAYFGPSRAVMFNPGALLIISGMLVVVYLLNFLYE